MISCKLFTIGTDFTLKNVLRSIDVKHFVRIENELSQMIIRSMVANFLYFDVIIENDFNFIMMGISIVYNSRANHKKDIFPFVVYLNINKETMIKVARVIQTLIKKISHMKFLKNLIV